MADAPERERFSLKRWSDRKLAVARGSTPAGPPPAARTQPPTSPSHGDAPAVQDPAGPTAAPKPTAAAESLPPVDTLTFDADFAAFMRPDVDTSLRRAALKKLFSDPRFNVMDGLDVYIDDYAKADPIDAETVRGLVQARYLFDPPKTRVNERGEVEDVPAVAQTPSATAPAEPEATPAQDAVNDRGRTVESPPAPGVADPDSRETES